jgi:hypothetical protein
MVMHLAGPRDKVSYEPDSSAMGASVYVTSGSKEKIDKAISLGAKGGFNYRDS